MKIKYKNKLIVNIIILIFLSCTFLFVTAYSFFAASLSTGAKSIVNMNKLPTVGTCIVSGSGETIANPITYEEMKKENSGWEKPVKTIVSNELIITAVPADDESTVNCNFNLNWKWLEDIYGEYGMHYYQSEMWFEIEKYNEDDGKWHIYGECELFTEEWNGEIEEWEECDRRYEFMPGLEDQIVSGNINVSAYGSEKSAKFRVVLKWYNLPYRDQSFHMGRKYYGKFYVSDLVASRHEGIYIPEETWWPVYDDDDDDDDWGGGGPV